MAPPRRPGPGGRASGRSRCPTDRDRLSEDRGGAVVSRLGTIISQQGEQQSFVWARAPAGPTHALDPHANPRQGPAGGHHKSRRASPRGGAGGQVPTQLGPAGNPAPQTPSAPEGQPLAPDPWPLKPAAGPPPRSSESAPCADRRPTPGPPCTGTGSVHRHRLSPSAQQWGASTEPTAPKPKHHIMMGTPSAPAHHGVTRARLGPPPRDWRALRPASEHPLPDPRCPSHRVPPRHPPKPKKAGCAPGRNRRHTKPAGRARGCLFDHGQKWPPANKGGD